MASHVIIDTGNGFRNEHLLPADVILALIPYRHDMWTETIVTDRRSEWVQVQWLAWLDREYTKYVHDQKPSNAIAKMVSFLDVQFAWHVSHRLSGDDEIYDASDSDAVDGWWTDYDDEEEFLSFLTPEGLHRHPATWEQACAEWRSRSRARTVRDVLRGSLDGEPATYGDFLQAIADEASSQWGSPVGAAGAHLGSGTRSR
ncbi:hypothetical protein [Nonomuraea sp. KM90]|uniref:hypothetical protein n=1 Tax=Nonomuraea sp. KM90 TaxID=3457428 RepID=UPI003FCCA1F6